ncbi:hypothetical protein F4859DRAFT_529490 [Xylaria cf. heliscus]|nr:hypothetical protein F4859DRAFT_529490 [Xylaria cf. heliscus]
MAEARASNRLTIRGPFPRFGEPGWGAYVKKWFEFARCSETCVGDDNDVSTPSPSTEAFAELRPVSLPNEIVLHILEYLHTPYKLRGRLSCKNARDQMPIFVELIVIFYKPRLWSSISAFQICRATRWRAIKRYGQPSIHSLPFDASVDSVSLRGDAIKATHHPLGSDGWNNSFFYSRVDEPPTGTMNRAETRINDDLLNKIKCVEIEEGKSFPFKLGQWRQAVRQVLSHLRVEELKIKLSQHDDTCGMVIAEDGMDPSAFLGDGKHCKHHDLYLLYELMHAINSIRPTLTVVEIEKTKAPCPALRPEPEPEPIDANAGRRDPPLNHTFPPSRMRRVLAEVWWNLTVVVLGSAMGMGVVAMAIGFLVFLSRILQPPPLSREAFMVHQILRGASQPQCHMDDLHIFPYLYSVQK